MNNCVQCGAKTINPKFCSLSCAASYNNKQFPKRIKEQKVCKYCGQMFDKRKGNRLYCSNNCKQLDNNIFEDTIRQTGCYYKPNSNAGTKAIRKYLIRKYGNQCMICGQSGDNWFGQPITLIVDHINGHANDWTVSNIRLVCPNCDSQLPTYKGRNKGNSTRKYTIIQK